MTEVVGDETVNVLELSKLLKVDRSVVVKRIQESEGSDDPFPLIQSGTKGRDYAIPAAKARAWWLRQDEKAKQFEKERRARLLEAVPPLPGFEPADETDPEVKDLIALERLKRERRENAVADSLLVPASVADAAVVQIANLSKGVLDNIISRLERLAFLPDEDLEAVIDVIHDGQDAYADELRKLKSVRDTAAGRASEL